MRIRIGDRYSRIYTKDPRALAIARKVCRAKPTGYNFSPQYKNGRWDGYISLMHTTSSFPTGLLGYVVPVLQERGYQVKLDWGDWYNTVIPPVTPDTLEGITLRDYQVEAANELLKRKRGIAKMATNSGKTEVFAALLKVFGDKRAVIVVHRKELLHQTANRLEKRLGCAVGRVGDGLNDPSRITVAMIQTLNNQLDSDGGFKHQDFDLNEVVIIDECHHVSSNQMMDVLAQIPGPYRFGFSGTPLKEDVLADMKLISMTGRVVTEITNADLISMGHSAVPIVHMHNIFNEGEESWKMDYHPAYQQFVVDNDDRNKLITEIAMRAVSTEIS